MSALDARPALDVWLKFDGPDDEDATLEANTYATADGFEVEWYHTAVGQVTSVPFETLEAARAWLTSQGFEDYSS